MGVGFGLVLGFELDDNPLVESTGLDVLEVFSDLLSVWETGDRFLLL
jgi:hypothetical protein